MPNPVGQAVRCPFASLGTKMVNSGTGAQRLQQTAFVAKPNEPWAGSWVGARSGSVGLECSSVLCRPPSATRCGVGGGSPRRCTGSGMAPM